MSEAFPEALCPDAMAVLAASPIEAQGPIGRVPYGWANHVQAGLGDEFGLDRERIDRGRLIALAREGQTEKFFLSVMAWGGMKVSHGISAWAARDTWRAPLESALAGRLSRSALYARFAATSVAGMRAAYFTKLIHFASPPGAAPIGYIMDQWTAKSVNLIRRRTVVVLDAAGYVQPVNDDAAYEAFCQAVDAIGGHLQIGGAEAEERIYSRGGRRPAPWRAYVKQQWPLAIRPSHEEDQDAR